MMAWATGRRIRPFLNVAVTIAVVVFLAACAAAPGESAGGASGWTEVTAAAAFAGVSLLDVSAFGSGFVAVGNPPDAGGLHYGGAFTSADGSSWTASSTAPFKGTTANVVGNVSEGLLTLGSSCGSECFGFKSWLSADGATWSGPVSPPDNTSRPTGFAEQGTTIVAVATELVDPALNHYQGSVYLSHDAASWTAGTGADAFDHTGLAGVASNGTGLVIVGSNLHEDGTRDGAAWTSKDGSTWATSTDDGSFKGALLQAVVAGSSGYLAVGSVAADGAVWASPDGTSWTRVDGSAFKSSPLIEVAASASGYLAIGKDANGAAAWTSKDGKAWQAVAGISGAADARFIAVAIGQSRSIIIGQPLGTAPTGLAWLGPLP